MNNEGKGGCMLLLSTGEVHNLQGATSGLPDLPIRHRSDHIRRTRLDRLLICVPERGRCSAIPARGTAAASAFATVSGRICLPKLTVYGGARLSRALASGWRRLRDCGSASLVEAQLSVPVEDCDNLTQSFFPQAQESTGYGETCYWGCRNQRGKATSWTQRKPM